jgi:YggT family protein
VFLLQTLITLYIYVLVISALLSWFPTTSSDSGLAVVKRWMAIITEPLLRPLRQIVPRPNIGGVGVDLSVLVAIFLLYIVRAIL